MLPISIVAGIALPAFAGASSGDVNAANAERIAPPTGKDLRDPKGIYEGETERKERLTKAGVVPVPPPGPDASASAFAKELYGVAESGMAAGDPDVARNLRLRTEISVASWFALASPERTKFGKDLSYGFGFWFPLDQLPSTTSAWAPAWFVGPVAHIYNGWVTTQGTGLSGLPVNAVSEWNSLEFGAGLVRQWEKVTAFGSTTAVDFRLEALPVRHINTTTYSLAGLAPGNEARSGVRFNPVGFGVGLGVAQTYGRAVSAGALVTLHAASPYQLKLRMGLTFGLQLGEDEETTRP